MASKRNLKLRDGSTVAVSGKVFHAQGIELIAHRVLLGLEDGRAIFGTGFVVSEPITGGLVVSRPYPSQVGAVDIAEQMMARPGAADHIRHKISLN